MRCSDRRTPKTGKQSSDDSIQQFNVQSYPTYLFMLNLQPYLASLVFAVVLPLYILIHLIYVTFLAAGWCILELRFAFCYRIY